MPTHVTEQEQRVAADLQERAEYHDRMASQYRRLVGLLFHDEGRPGLNGCDFDLDQRQSRAQ